MDWKNNISIDPAILVGKPVIKGSRLAVEFIVELLSEGWSHEQLIQSYPGITSEDIRACLAYAADALHAEKVYRVGI